MRAIDEAGNESDWTSFNFYFADESLTHKAIIVAGGGPYEGNNLWKATKMVADKAYQALCYQGYTADSVYYISAENAGHIDADATNNSLQYAIKTWAQDADDLLIYMVDHGGDGTFVMGEYENLLATDLDNWLNTLQQTSQVKVTLVYDACQSGSFLFYLKPPEGKERILIATTNEDEPALFADGGTVSFSWYFWTHILSGDTFYDSFIYAKNGITFSCEQYALLEAVWDGNANQKNDKDMARAIRIGNEIRTAGSLPRITGISPPQTLNVETSALIYAEGVLDETGISRVWAVITPPGYSSGSPDNPITDLPVLELTLNGNNRYEGTYHNFTEPGIYKITILAENNTGSHSLPQTTTVAVNTLLKGDINGDWNVDMADVIIALKVLAGMDVYGLIRTDYTASGVDVNGQNKIGLDEVIYIMQNVSGLRD